MLNNKVYLRPLFPAAEAWRYGTGKPERLKYFEQDVWSRRVSHEHPMVYVISSKEEDVDIVSCKSRYDEFVLSS